MKHFFIGCAALLLSSCSLIQEKQSLQERMNAKVQEVSELAELGTTEYTITKIVKASDVSWYKIGDRKILFSCKAILKAGIDMKNFSAQNVIVDEATQSVKVRLPKAKLLSMNMPAEEAKLAYEKVSATRFDFSATERANLLKQGEEDILQSIPQLGILEEAEKNATSFFKAMLKQLGFNNITIEFVEI